MAGPGAYIYIYICICSVVGLGLYLVLYLLIALFAYIANLLLTSMCVLAKMELCFQDSVRTYFIVSHYVQNLADSGFSTLNTLREINIAMAI